MKPRILIAGIGNIFHRDDAFGVIVAQELVKHGPIEGTRVCDFGIRGIDLAFAFLDGYDFVILVDALSHGQQAGTIYVIEPDLSKLEESPAGQMDGHDLGPWQVLQQAARMGAKFGRVVVVGCEPESIGESEDGRSGLSAVVEAAIEPGVATIRSLVAEFLIQECAA